MSATTGAAGGSVLDPLGPPHPAGPADPPTGPIRVADPTGPIRRPAVGAPTPPRPPRTRAARVAPLLLGGAALALLPALALLLDRDAMGGLGLAGVLPGWAWVGIGAVVVACTLELLAPDPRTRVLTALTGVLGLTTTGLASVVEPGARLAVSWWHLGFAEAIARDGQVPPGVDARFSWAGFFSQWAWISDAAGGMRLDLVLRWTPPVVALLWCAAVYVLARHLLGGTRAPWVATWLFLGLNWIEQDYFSPQATAMVLALTVLVLVTGPLATARAPLTDPARPVRSRVLALARPSTWRRRDGRSPLRAPHPGTPRSQVLLAWGIVALCCGALAVSHQLTPVALGVALALLALAGRVWGGRGLVLVLVVAVVAWIVLGGREFWLNQLTLLTSDVGDASGSVRSALGDRLVGDPGQVVVKALRVALGAATVLLALLGSWVRWRRTGEIVWIVAALAPAGMVTVQSYGGEVGLRVLLYALPFCAVLGTEALRAGVRWADARGWAGSARVVLAVGLACLAALLVLVRGGNDAYVALRPSEIALARAVIDAAPAGSLVLPLAEQSPNNVTRVGEVAQDTRTCASLAEDPVRCTLADDPVAVYAVPTMEAYGVVVEGRAPGWTRQAMTDLVATGRYRRTVDDGPYQAVVRVPPPPATAGAAPSAATPMRVVPLPSTGGN